MVSLSAGDEAVAGGKTISPSQSNTRFGPVAPERVELEDIDELGRDVIYIIVTLFRAEYAAISGLNSRSRNDTRHNVIRFIHCLSFIRVQAHIQFEHCGTSLISLCSFNRFLKHQMCHITDQSGT